MNENKERKNADGRTDGLGIHKVLLNKSKNNFLFLFLKAETLEERFLESFPDGRRMNG